MKDWIKVTLILCAFGVLREIRPSEPYVSEFILGEWRNITEEQLTHEIYPIGTYSYLALLVVIFLVTDFLRFKPIIILSGICGIIVYSILLWTTSLAWLQASQFFYGLYIATEVAYYTYIYAKVETDKYPKVSSYTRMAALTGRFLSGVSAQLLTMFGVMDYRQLNYVTFSAQILATFWAIWLPRVKYGVYFHRNKASKNSLQTTITSPNKNQTEVKSEKPSCTESFGEATTLIARHARAAYSRPPVIAWSLLYAASLFLYVQAQTYVQMLWINIEPDMPVAYNGAVEATLTLLGAGGAFLASKVGPEFLPAPAAALQGLAMLAASYPSNIYLSYIGYIVTGVVFHYTITLASAKIAGQLSDDSCFGLIFGINTLIGSALQALFMLVLVSPSGLEISVHQQYYTLAGGYMLLAAAWFTGWIVHSFWKKKSLDLFNDSSPDL